MKRLWIIPLLLAALLLLLAACDSKNPADTPAEDIYKAWQTDAVAFQSETLSYRLY